MRHYFTPTSLAISKIQRVRGVEDDVKQLKPSYIAGGNTKSCTALENSFAVS